MDDVRDPQRKLICRADGFTGLVEIRVRDGRYRFRLPVGYTMEYRKGVYVTCLTRKNERLFVYEHYADEL